ncbi:MAG: hypothetical protein ACXWVF_11440, partial [Telluria sp.]
MIPINYFKKIRFTWFLPLAAANGQGPAMHLSTPRSITESDAKVTPHACRMTALAIAAQRHIKAPVKLIQKLFALGYVLIVALFFACAVALIALAGMEMWEAVTPAADSDTQSRFNKILECIGLLTIAVAS